MPSYCDSMAYTRGIPLYHTYTVLVAHLVEHKAENFEVAGSGPV